jgi:hypothetical protein
MSKLASTHILARACQSSLLYDAMIDPIKTLSGKSFLSYLAPSTQYLAFFSEINSMFEKEASVLRGLLVALNILGDTLTISSLSSTKVLVTANPQPCSNALLIMGYDVVGGAEANPKGLLNFTPAIVTPRSTKSTSVKNPGRTGVSPTSTPCLFAMYLCRYQLATLPSFTASTKF